MGSNRGAQGYEMSLVTGLSSHLARCFRQDRDAGSVPRGTVGKGQIRCAEI